MENILQATPFKVEMLKSQFVLVNHFKGEMLKAGEVHELRESVACRLIRRGYARKV